MFVAARTSSDRTSQVSIRLMERADISFAVRLHTEVLHPGFFVRLGPRFLSAYYSTYLTSPAAIALTGEHQGEPVGFLVGVTDRDAHYRHVIRSERVNLGIALLSALATRPTLASQFARTRLLRYVRGARRHARPRSQSQPNVGYHGVLSHVAVSPALRRSGVGRALVSHFVDVAETLGATRLSLATLEDNLATQMFYKEQGWQPGAVRHDADGVSWTTFSLVLR